MNRAAYEKIADALAAQMKAAQPHKVEADGTRHPAEHYAYRENLLDPSTWDNLMCGADGKPDPELLAKAYAVYGPQATPAEKRAQRAIDFDLAQKRIEAAAKQIGMNPATLKEWRGSLCAMLSRAVRQKVWL